MAYRVEFIVGEGETIGVIRGEGGRVVAVLDQGGWRTLGISTYEMAMVLHAIMGDDQQERPVNVGGDNWQGAPEMPADGVGF